MIGRDYLQFIEDLFVEGMEKVPAKKKFMNKWRRENTDIVWKEEKLASSTFETHWEILSTWDSKRLLHEKRKRILKELSNIVEGPQ